MKLFFNLLYIKVKLNTIKNLGSSLRFNRTIFYIYIRCKLLTFFLYILLRIINKNSLLIL